MTVTPPGTSVMSSIEGLTEEVQSLHRRIDAMHQHHLTQPQQAKAPPPPPPPPPDVGAAQPPWAIPALPVEVKAPPQFVCLFVCAVALFYESFCLFFVCLFVSLFVCLFF